MLPPVLQDAVADSEPAAAHAKLVARAEQAASKAAELRTAHAKAVKADEEAEEAFAAGKRAKLSPPSAVRAADAVEQAEREQALLKRKLPVAADALLTAAHPYLDEAAAQLERLADEGDEEVARHLTAALEVLDRRAEVGRQAAWLDVRLP